MSKSEIIRILKTRKKPLNVTTLMNLTGKSRSTLNTNIKNLLREPDPVIDFVEKPEYNGIIRYYYLIKKKNRKV